VSDVAASPFETGSDELIPKLPAQRYDAAAVVEAIARLKQALRGGGDDAGPASAT
jgi:hypothetical protein